MDIVNQSVERGWKTFYPLEQSKKNKDICPADEILGDYSIF